MPTIADWRAFYVQNRRGTQLAELWTRDTARHLRSHPALNRDSAIFDFGCGYFDLGLALAPHVRRVDGLEIDEYSLNLARSRTADLPGTVIHSSNDDVRPGTYDLILANSVFQYLDDDDIVRTLKLFRSWLKPGGMGEVLLIDLIPTGYSPPRDALRSMWVALRHGIPWTMFRFLWKAATSPHGRAWHRIDPPRMAELANQAGFRCRQLKRNLTPSLQRYSCELKVC